MKVVALVSGGKDSCYNMMLCQEHGHEIVALANLLPEDDAVDELDSFMYQTVGHQLIAAYATCMGLPLFRRRIRGKSKSQGLQYAATEGDEVEDLEALLAAVKRRIPDVQGVSSGAIASDYQRLRVENVCSRLGLISLAFLWRREQSGLLLDMISAGVQAILVKVAAMGLSPEKHLGKDLATMQPVLERLKTLYGCNVCGEGGEYETLTLDCPLFKFARIVLDNSDIVIHSADAFAPVGILHTTKFHLKNKTQVLSEGPANANDGLDETRAEVIMVEDDRASCSKEEQKGSSAQKGQTDATTSCSLRSRERGFAANVTVDTEEDLSDGLVRIRCRHEASRVENDGEVSSITNGVHPKSRVEVANGSQEPVTPDTTESAVRLLLTSAEAELEARGLTWADVIYVYLFLAEMGHFAQANAAYKSVITEGKCACGGGVPSRSTVQVDLPPTCAAKVEVLVALPDSGEDQAADKKEGASGRGQDWSRAERRGKDGNSDSKEAGAVLEDSERGGVIESQKQGGAKKKVLHVQSISSWAPCCIGPYSQATFYNERLYMAGQLGLDPASMELVSGGAGPQMARALISCEAVAQAMGTSVRTNAEAITIFCDRRCTKDDLDAVREEFDCFLGGRQSARYTDSFNRASLTGETGAESASEAVQLPRRRDLREEVAREMLRDSGLDDAACEANEESCNAIRSEARVTYEMVPALPKGALVEVVVLCKLKRGQ